MNKELKSQLDTMEHEYGIDKETLITLFEEAMEQTARKCPKYSHEVCIRIDRTSYEIKCTAKLFVVEKIENEADEITLDEVHERFPEADLGDEIEWEFPLTTFGRIAIQTAQGQFRQRIRSLQKRRVCEQFQGQIGQLVTGEVRRIDREGIVIGFQLCSQARSGMSDNAPHVDDEGLLPKKNKIPGENFEEGDLVTALLLEADPERQGAAIVVSRTDPDFVRRLFEREVTEISEGIIEIKSVARDAGYRCKIAVQSHEPRVDSVGACVGQRGSRVRTIVHELRGEKVDIIEWSPDIATYVTNALKPSAIKSIEVKPEVKTVKVEVPEDQLSLAIGKRGQNAKLASQLTGWRIDIIKTAAAPAEDSFETSRRKAIDTIAALEGIGDEAATKLVDNGFNLELIAESEPADVAKLIGCENERAEAVIKAAKASLNL
ncbi:MAG: transcription termination factor NusA [Victivallales bacterium]|nr:transcription termination factor NusA [Victivallales bacterium]